MAKIDLTKINGYEAMTPEEKVKAIESLEIPETDYSGYVKKDVFDKTAADLSDVKKKYNALITDEQKKKEQSEEELTTLREQVEALQKEKLIASHKAQYLAMGYDEKLAESSAQAMANGDIDKVFAHQKTFLENHDKSIKADLMKGTPTPPVGETGKTMTLKKLKSLPTEERFKFAEQHPEEYKELYEGEKT